MQKLILVSVMVLAFAPRVWAGANVLYTFTPYQYSIALTGTEVSFTGSNGVVLPESRNLIPQGPISGKDATGCWTSAASQAACEADAAAVKKQFAGHPRVITACKPTAPVVVEGDIQ